MDDNDILDKIYSKVEKISDDVMELKITAVKHEETLQTHVKRSDSLETLVNHLKEEDIKPLQRDMSQIQGAAKIITVLIAAGSLILGILKILSKI